MTEREGQAGLEGQARFAEQLVQKNREEQIEGYIRDGYTFFPAEDAIAYIEDLKSEQQQEQDRLDAELTQERSLIVTALQDAVVFLDSVPGKEALDLKNRISSLLR